MSLSTVTVEPLTTEGGSIQPSTSSDSLGRIATSSSPSQNDSAPSSNSPLPEKDGLTKEDQHPLQPLPTYSRNLREKKYILYVESLAKSHPSLRTVSSYVQEDGSTKSKECHEKGDCIQCQYFSVVYMDYIVGERSSTFQTPRVYAHEPARTALEKLEAVLSADDGKDVFRLLIVEDIQPLGMVVSAPPLVSLGFTLTVTDSCAADLQFLGALLSLDPRIFLYYLDRHRSFPSHRENISALDYPELYLYSPLESEKPQNALSGDIIIQGWPRRGPVKRLWRAMFGHFQRIIWAKISVPRSFFGLYNFCLTILTGGLD